MFLCEKTDRKALLKDKTAADVVKISAL